MKEKKQACWIYKLDFKSLPFDNIGPESNYWIAQPLYGIYNFIG